LRAFADDLPSRRSMWRGHTATVDGSSWQHARRPSGYVTERRAAAQCRAMKFSVFPL
jgi:hypothetical protein